MNWNSSALQKRMSKNDGQKKISRKMEEKEKERKWSYRQEDECNRGKNRKETEQPTRGKKTKKKRTSELLAILLRTILGDCHALQQSKNQTPMPQFLP